MGRYSRRGIPANRPVRAVARKLGSVKRSRRIIVKRMVPRFGGAPYTRTVRSLIRKAV